MTGGGTPPFGALLKRYRLAAALSQEALAERAGLSTRGISDLERGLRRVPRPETAAMLADALELSGEARAALLAPLLEHAPPVSPAVDDAAAATLPAPLTALLGRAPEQRALTDLLRGTGTRPRPRLVTLTGPGGVGKTRLALEVAQAVARDFADGVRFVDLAPLRDPALVASTIAGVLGMHEEGQRPLRDALSEFLRPREILLLLDNFEQVAGAAPFLATLLTACPRLHALVTSRATLRLRGEREFPVPPLAIPAAADRLLLLGRDYPAVELFVQRAREARPEFRLDDGNAATVAALCRRLDGLPLALELAAAQVRLLPPGAVLTRLEQRLPLPIAGPRDLPARQRTLHETLDWSHDLLATRQRALFRRLAVFSGGCDLEAALAVCGESPGNERDAFEPLDDVMALIDLSLLRAGEEGGALAAGGEVRFGMLETVREYAAERLEEAGEAIAVERRHAAHFLALVSASPVVVGPDRVTWLARLDRERDNLRAAWGRALARGQWELLAGATDGLGYYLEARAHAEEGAEAFRLAVETLAGARGEGEIGSGMPLLALLLAWRGAFRRMLGQLDAAEADLREALARLHAAAAVGVDNRAARAFALLRLGQVAWDRGHAEAQGLYERCLALYRELERTWETSTALWELGRLGYRLGWYAAADERLRESLALRGACGDARGSAEVLQTLSQTAAATGRFDEALRLARRANDLLRELGDESGRALGLRRLGVILAWAGQPAAARPLLEESLARYLALGLRGELGWAHFHLSTACVMLGDYAAAETNARRAIVCDSESGSPANLAHDLWMLGVALLSRGAEVEAEAALREAVALSGTGEDGEVIWPLPTLAYVVWRRGDTNEAQCHLCAALRAALARRDTLTALTALPAAALLLATRGEVERAVELDTLTWRHPTIANNRSAVDLWRPPLDDIARALSPEAVAAARARGQGLELWPTVAGLQVELSLAPVAKSGGLIGAW